ncbi:MAG: hypothetical protein QW812_03430 [Thermoplasmataceae archaeon]
MSEHIKEMFLGLDYDVIAIMSPHGLRLKRHLPVINTENLEGRLTIGSETLSGAFKTERELAKLVAESNPIFEEVGFATSSGFLSTFPLDFGTIIPLSFTAHRNLVCIGQSRLESRASLIEAGRSFAEVASHYNKRVLVIVSADQAHTHSASGPYGYSPMAEKYENAIEAMVRRGDLAGIEDIDDSIIEQAKPDSYWGLLFLKGVISRLGLQLKLKYHYIEGYFGMLAAETR